MCMHVDLAAVHLAAFPLLRPTAVDFIYTLISLARHLKGLYMIAT